MGYQRERDTFLATIGSELGIDFAQALLRYATTLDRLAVAQCNGDWPADNGERKVIACPLCEQSWAPSQITGQGKGREHYPKACLNCRTTARAVELVRDSAYQIVTQGDPRGYVLKLYPATAPAASIDNGSARCIGVPTRNR